MMGLTDLFSGGTGLEFAGWLSGSRSAESYVPAGGGGNKHRKGHRVTPDRGHICG